MDKPKVLVLSTQDGDWEQLWIDGDLIEEGHSLGESDDLFLWRQGIAYGFGPDDIQYEELDDEDDEYAMDYGNFPDNVYEKYINP